MISINNCFATNYIYLPECPTCLFLFLYVTGIQAGASLRRMAVRASGAARAAAAAGGAAAAAAAAAGAHVGAHREEQSHGYDQEDDEGRQVHGIRRIIQPPDRPARPRPTPPHTGRRPSRRPTCRRARA